MVRAVEGKKEVPLHEVWHEEPVRQSAGGV